MAVPGTVEDRKRAVSVGTFDKRLVSERTALQRGVRGTQQYPRRVPMQLSCGTSDGERR